MPKNLLIPGKYGFSPERYKSDMQTLEQWGRQPIQQLLAGSGITLSPASGLATDKNGNGPNPVTISSSGGGGGGTAAFADIVAGPEQLVPFVGTWWPLANVVGSTNVAGQTPIPCYPNTLPEFDSGSNQPSFGNSWFTIAGPGQSVNLLPFCATPPFTGGTGDLEFRFYYWAVSIDFANGAMYTMDVFVPSFTKQQATVADAIINWVAFGTDLTLTAGTGFFGNGLVSAGVGTPYLAGVSGSLVIPGGTTF